METILNKIDELLELCREEPEAMDILVVLHVLRGSTKANQTRLFAEECAKIAYGLNNSLMVTKSSLN